MRLPRNTGPALLFLSGVLAATAPQLAYAASCSGVPEWNAITIYHAGDRLVKSDTLYQARQDIWNAPPDHSSGAPYYDNLGSCDGGDGNIPPGVSLTAPSDGASFPEGSTIAVSANASDSDGSIARVEFFQGNTPIGTDTSPPYGLAWAAATSGSYAFKAVATDDGGSSVTSATVSITVTGSGGGGDCYPAWSTSSIYTQGDRVTHNGRNYQAKWWTQGENPTQSGEYGVWKDLGACSGGDNAAPTVTLTSPTDGASYTVGADIAVAANAVDSDGSIAQVEFFRGAATLGIDTSAPYAVTWNDASAGSHVFKAVATDNLGLSATSTTVTISVNSGTDTTPPSVPTGLAATAQSASSISLAWNASTDNAGGSGVAGYDVYRNGSRVASPTSTSYLDTGLAADTTYAYTVRARDSASPPNASAQSAAVSATTLPGGGGGGDKRIIGYFAQWGIYARGYRVRNIQTSGSAAKLTHINYAFGNVRNNRCEVGVTIPSNPDTGAGGDAFADYTKSFSAAESVDGVADTWDQSLRGNWNQLRKLKAMHPGLKVLISLGGWTWSRGFAEAARPENREAFVASCIDAYIRGNLPVTDGAGGPGAAAGVFDGIDIDWEYPAACGLSCGTSEDNANFTALLAEFRSQLDAVRPGLLLSIAAGAGIDKIRVTDPGTYHQSLDYINVMTYDFHGTWDPQTNHHSALFDSPNDPSTGDQRFYNSNDAIEAFLMRGVPAAKLTLGIGFYGRGWTGVANINHGLYQSGTAAPGTYEAGNEDYKVLKGRPGTIYTDPDAYATWKYDGNTFWSYDTPAMIAEKMNYVQLQGLGGAFFWEFSGDDAQGSLVDAISGGLD